LEIDTETRNFIAYNILNLQYETIDLVIKFVKYSNRKTLNNVVLDIVCSYLLSDDIYSKVKLRLDSLKNLEDTNIEDDENINSDELL